ncbi:MotE family protein [Caldicellulosiruptor naganoensis]|uniref:Magnesium transporter MgtE intracellular domain-containing protein n=2 Tax=Caldicellulosiruptor naganoensis TaxID=29324 RepID=A0ABY7BGZ3_9FIRM|nr:hypothetical protein [Caldicellulosiruptor naganoensis]WAM32104.1 hypothetical protein OTJ99_000609 [Caldicellulosiruptor naganoensis]
MIELFLTKSTRAWVMIVAESRNVDQVKLEKKQENKKKKRGKNFLVVLLVFLLLGGGSFAAVYFNLFGAKTAIDNLLQKTPFAKKTVQSTQKVDLEKVYKQQIAELEKQNKDLQSKLKQLQVENSNLQKQVQDLTTRLNDIVAEQTDTSNKAKNFSSYLQNMDSKKAAKILESLIDTNVEMASIVLQNIPTEIASEILSNIPSDKTIKLLGISNQSGILQAQSISSLVDIYKNIDSKVAASIFESMMDDKTKYQLALSILKRLDTKTSSQIISNMKPENAAKVTSDLSALR